MNTRREPLLDVEVSHAAYGTAQVLHDLAFAMDREVVSIVGRNGMGKSTLCNVVMGLHKNAQGSIRVEGKEILGKRPTQIGRAGIGYVPQGRRVFPSLTVEEHFKILGPHWSSDWPLERIYELFPRLKERRTNLGGNLSGGEQQMLAISRAVALGPRLLVMDEPSEGLAPVIVDVLVDACISLAETSDMGVLVVEQNMHAALRLAERILVMVHGQIVADMSSKDFLASPDMQEQYLGVSRSR